MATENYVQKAIQQIQQALDDCKMARAGDAVHPLEVALKLLSPAKQSREERIAAEMDRMASVYEASVFVDIVNPLRNIAAILREPRK